MTPRTNDTDTDKMREAERLLDVYYGQVANCLLLGGQRWFKERDDARAALLAHIHTMEAPGLSSSQELAAARRHGYLEALSAGTARNLVVLLNRGVKQLEAWHKEYGRHDPKWLPPAGDVRWMEDVAEAVEGRQAALSAPPAPAVRMLTAITALVEQIEKCNPVDDHGHNFTVNSAYLAAKDLL